VRFFSADRAADPPNRCDTALPVADDRGMRGGRSVLLTVLLLAAASVDAAAPIAYPTGFREWMHVKSAIVGPASPAFATEGGIHHIYANPAAVAGYRTGKFADGATIVYELLETTEANGVTKEGARRRLDMMTRDSARFAATGGWGFERFMHGREEERALGEGGGATCYDCHKKMEATSLVFSVLRD
jgi:hypothetical protein